MTTERAAASMQKKVKANRSRLTVFYWIIGAILGAVLVALPLLNNNYVTHVVIQMLFFAYLGTSWNIMGQTGQLSFGHATFFGIGAYTSTLLLINLGVTPWIGMFVGGALAFVAGIAIGYVGFRYGLRGVFFAFITLATAEIFRLLALLADPITKGAEGLLLPWTGHDPLMFAFAATRKEWPYYIILAMAAAAIAYSLALKRTRFGYYLAAIRENEDAAEMLGINASQNKILALGISAFMTALAGTFYAQYFQHFDPGEVFGTTRSFEIIFPVIIGGGGSVMGPPIGAFILLFFEEISRTIFPPNLHGFHRMLYGLIIVFMIMYLPQGIAGLLSTWRDKYLRKNTQAEG